MLKKKTCKIGDSKLDTFPSSFFVMALLVSIAMGSSPIQADTLIVSNRQDKSVTMYDTESKKLLATIGVEAGLHEFAVSPDGATIVGSCYGSGPGHRTPDSRLIAIDVSKIESTVHDLGENPRPNDLRFLPDGRKVLVTSERRQRLLEFDLLSGSISRTIPTSIEAGHMLATTPDGAFAFVPSVANGQVAKVDLRAEFETPKQSTSIFPTSLGAEGIDVSPDGKQVWIACNRSDKVYAYDTNTLNKIHELGQDGFPFRVRFAKKGKYVLVACPMTNRLVVFDSTSAQKVGNILVDGQPTNIAVSADGDRAFVVCGQAKEIAEVNLDTLKVDHLYPTGNLPDAIAVTNAVPSPDAIERADAAKAEKQSRIEHFVVDSGDAKLACTLTRPANDNSHSPWPTIVVIGHGAGLTRDGVSFEVDGFTKIGLACVTYDRRGHGDSTGQSGGSFSATAVDVKAIVAALQENESVDSDRLGISCRSRGAWVAPIVASTDESIKFMVALAPPARSVAQTMVQARLAQVENLIETREKSMLARDAMVAMCDFARKKITLQQYNEIRNQVLAYPWGDRLGLPPEDHPIWKWLENNIDFDPTSQWQFVQQPVCAVFAELDQDVPLSPHRFLLESTFENAGLAQLTSYVVANADHEFNPVATQEVASLPADEVWRVVGQWLREQQLVAVESKQRAPSQFDESNPPTVNAIVERSINARGGHDRLAVLQSVRITSVLFRNNRKTDDLSENPQFGNYRAVFTSLHRSQTRHGFDGDQLWESSEAVRKLLDRKHADDLKTRLQDNRCVEKKLLRKGFESRLTGEAKIDDEICFVVTWHRLGTKPSSKYYFAKSSGRMLQTETHAFPDATIPISSAIYSDYRDVNG